MLEPHLELLYRQANESLDPLITGGDVVVLDEGIMFFSGDHWNVIDWHTLHHMLEATEETPARFLVN